MQGTDSANHLMSYTFPISYENSNYTVTGHIWINGINGLNLTKTPTGFTVNQSARDQSSIGGYIAIGY